MSGVSRDCGDGGVVGVGVVGSRYYVNRQSGYGGYQWFLVRWLVLEH